MADSVALNDAEPLVSVVTWVLPRYTWAWPGVAGSTEALRKNSITKAVLAAKPVSCPWMIVVPPLEFTPWSVGAGWLLLPPLTRAMPCEFWKIALPRIALPLPSWT